ncbi:hypothetical protein M8818_003457 [Zalaria obscura]|uniref:Uncharacterized protein n=1 Tax=Zalaria obscura TaxID=2024903 RepID=A0ACC3SE96_9PEZI
MAHAWVWEVSVDAERLIEVLCRSWLPHVLLPGAPQTDVEAPLRLEHAIDAGKYPAGTPRPNDRHAPRIAFGMYKLAMWRTITRDGPVSCCVEYLPYPFVPHSCHDDEAEGVSGSPFQGTTPIQASFRPCIRVSYDGLRLVIEVGIVAEPWRSQPYASRSAGERDPAHPYTSSRSCLMVVVALWVSVPIVNIRTHEQPFHFTPQCLE